jgi:hypothetical protein
MSPAPQLACLLSIVPNASVRPSPVELPIHSSVCPSALLSLRPSTVPRLTWGPPAVGAAAQTRLVGEVSALQAALRLVSKQIRDNPPRERPGGAPHSLTLLSGGRPPAAPGGGFTPPGYQPHGIASPYQHAPAMYSQPAAPLTTTRVIKVQVLPEFCRGGMR